MKRSDLIRDLRLPEAAAEQLNAWKFSAAAGFDESCEVPDAELLRQTVGAWQCAETLLEELTVLADTVRQTEALRRWFFFRQKLHFFDITPQVVGEKEIPKLTELLGAAGDAQFNLLLALSAHSLRCATYRKLGVPEKYAVAPLAALELTANEFKKTHGFFGFPVGLLHWSSHYVAGRLFRIGRLEYMPREPPPLLPAGFRHRRSRKIVLLARDGWLFNAAGLRLGPDESPAGAAFRSRIYGVPGGLAGTPIDPRGFARIGERFTVLDAEYEPLYLPWSFTAEIHIPGGGGMTMDLCKESLREAQWFFPRYLGRQVEFFWCASWVLNPELARELPESNIAALQSRCYLTPHYATPDAGLNFVFGRTDGDWLKYPTDNSLRRAFHRIIARGERLRSGAMMIDKAGADAFKPGFYQLQSEGKS